MPAKAESVLRQQRSAEHADAAAEFPREYLACDAAHRDARNWQSTESRRVEFGLQQLHQTGGVDAIATYPDADIENVRHQTLKCQEIVAANMISISHVHASSSFRPVYRLGTISNRGS